MRVVNVLASAGNIDGSAVEEPRPAELPVRRGDAELAFDHHIPDGRQGDDQQHGKDSPAADTIPSFARAEEATHSLVFWGRFFSNANYLDENIVGWIRSLSVLWRARNLTLACPNCKGTPTRPAFKRARFTSGEQTLICEQCGTDNFATLWRFEGAAQREQIQNRAFR
jgi:hypothetical protein